VRTIAKEISALPVSSRHLRRTWLVEWPLHFAERLHITTRDAPIRHWPIILF